MAGRSALAILFWFGLAIGVVWIFWLVFVYGRRRQASATLLIVSAFDAACGLANFLLGTAHLTGVIRRALGRSAAAFTYDFRFYALILLGFSIAVLGLVCLSLAMGLTRRKRSSWKAAVWSSIWLVIINGPLVPIQGFAILLGSVSLLNVLALAVTRRRFGDTRG